MLFNAGTGEMIKAALIHQIYTVAICRNSAHKNMFFENLAEFVTVTGLVNLAMGAPEKPPELLAFEKQLQTDARTGKASVAGLPPPPQPPGGAPVGGRMSPAENDAGTAAGAEGNAGAAAAPGAAPKPKTVDKKRTMLAFGQASL